MQPYDVTPTTPPAQRRAAAASLERWLDEAGPGAVVRIVPCTPPAPLFEAGQAARNEFLHEYRGRRARVLYFLVRPDLESNESAQRFLEQVRTAVQPQREIGTYSTVLTVSPVAGELTMDPVEPLRLTLATGEIGPSRIRFEYERRPICAVLVPSASAAVPPAPLLEVPFPAASPSPASALLRQLALEREQRRRGVAAPAAALVPPPAEYFGPVLPPVSQAPPNAQAEILRRLGIDARRLRRIQLGIEPALLPLRIDDAEVPLDVVRAVDGNEIGLDQNGGAYVSIFFEGQPRAVGLSPSELTDLYTLYEAVRPNAPAPTVALAAPTPGSLAAPTLTLPGAELRTRIAVTEPAPTLPAPAAAATPARRPRPSVTAQTLGYAEWYTPERQRDLAQQLQAVPPQERFRYVSRAFLEYWRTVPAAHKEALAARARAEEAGTEVAARVKRPRTRAKTTTPLTLPPAPVGSLPQLLPTPPRLGLGAIGVDLYVRTSTGAIRPLIAYPEGAPPASSPAATAMALEAQPPPE